MMLEASEWLDFEAAPALLVTSAGIVLAANGPAARLIGRARNELLSRSLTEFVLQQPSSVLEYLRLASRTRDRIPGHFSWQGTDGTTQEMHCDGGVVRPRTPDSPATILLRFCPQEDATEQFLVLNEKISALSREISIRKRAEEERDQLLVSERAARKEAERVSQVKDEFLATLSHELRTPLNAILGWTQILRMARPNDPDLREGLDVIERNSRLQTQLIDDLLDMSRIISGKLRLDVQRVELATVLEAAIQSTMPAFEARNIRLQRVLDSIGGVVMGDPNRLQQVFWNLLTNASKFTPKGGRVQLLLERVNSHVEVSVIDTGCGIKPEFLPHVFDRFQQADSSTTRSFGGLGLGLAIVRHIVELHGGTVRAKSPGEGMGATFVVMLPVTVLHDELNEDRVHPRSSAMSPEVEAPPSMTGLKVLVVDDEPDSLAMAAKVLVMCGCQVLTANSAADAFELLKKERPDVLVSDIGMPQEDGYVLIKRVRALPPQQGGATPAIALTAFARSDDRRKAMLAGFQMHLAKPAESAELIAVVASVAGLTMPQ